MGNISEEQLLQEALAVLRQRLPPAWTAQLSTYQLPDGSSDPVLQLEGGSSNAGLLIELRTSLTPRQIQTEFGNPSYRRLRAHDRRDVVVVAPYLSRRARELLSEDGICYLDLTGNVRIVVQYPLIWVETEGATKAPAGDRREGRGLRGAAVGKIVRALVDVAPPYGVTELSRAARVDAGYTTRVLETLASEALIQRGPRGRVDDVDWPALLRRRAAVVDLLSRSSTKLYVAPSGAAQTLNRLQEPERDRVVVTGSFAASRIAPIAVPALLVAYTLLDRDELARQLGLLEVSHGADVALVRPSGTGPFMNARFDDGTVFAAPSQVALDCLSGSGRMPSEGEAVIAWMQDNSKTWRAESLDATTWPEWVPE